MVTSEYLQALSCDLVFALNGLVRISRAAHEDAQFLARRWLHRRKSFVQKLGRIRFDQDGLAPGGSQAAERPVGQELGIAVQATGCLSKATANIARQRMSEWVGSGREESTVLGSEDTFGLFQGDFHERISCWLSSEHIYYTLPGSACTGNFRQAAWLVRIQPF